MAVAVIASTGTFTTTTGTSLTSFTITMASGSNTALLVMLSWENSSVPAGLVVTYDVAGANQAMTAITGTNTGTNGGLSSAGVMYGLVNPTGTGSKTITVSWTGSLSGHGIAIQLSGVNQTNVATAFPHGTFVANNASTASPITTAVTSATGNIVGAYAIQQSSPFGTINGTTIAQESSGPNDACAGNYNSGAATVNPSFAFTGPGVWAIIATDILASAGAAAPFVQPWFDSNPLYTKYAPSTSFFAAAEQQFSTFVRVPPVTPASAAPGWVPFFDSGKPPPTAALQRWDAFQPRGVIPPPNIPAAPGWTPFFDSAGPPPTAARQRWDFFQPQGAIVSVVPAKPGWVPFFDSARVKIAVNGDATFPLLPMPAVPYGLAQGFDQNDSTWIPPITMAKHPFAAFQPQGRITSTTPQGFSDFFDSNPLTSNSFPSSTQYGAAEQQWATFTPRGTIVSITPQGWTNFFDSGPAPMSAARQPFDVTRRLDAPLVPTWGWAAFFDAGRALASAANQPFDAARRLTVQAAATPATWGWNSFFDASQVKITPTGEFTLPPPLGTLSFAAVGFDASDMSWVRLRDPGQQPFSTLGIKPAVIAVATPGWNSFYDVGRAPTTASLQRWDAFAPRGTIVSITPQGWSSFFDSGRAPASAARQPFDSPLGAPPLPVLYGIAQGFDQNDVSWIPPINPAKHPFSAMAPFLPPPPVQSTGPLGWARFFDSGKAPASAALMPFDARRLSQPPAAPVATYGWGAFFDSSRVRIAVNGEAFLPPPLGTLSFLASGFDQNDVSWVKLADPAKHPFSLLVIKAPVVAVTPGPLGWARFFDAGPPPPSAARQPWAAFQARGNVPAPPQPNGWTTFYDAGRAPSTAAQQPWSFFQPRGRIVSVTPQGFGNFYDSGPPAPSAARQQWDAWPAEFIIPPPNSFAWGFAVFYDSWPVPPLRDALQPFAAWTPQVINPPPPPPITQIGCVIQGRACDCGLPHRRLTMFQGATWEIQGNLAYADGTPFNLGPGCQILWALQDAAGNNVMFLSLGHGITVLDAAAGTCLLLIRRPDSLTVPLGNYVDQLRAIDPTGYVSDQWCGPITVAESYFN